MWQWAVGHPLVLHSISFFQVAPKKNILFGNVLDCNVPYTSNVELS